MSRLTDLHAIADRNLGGLNADGRLMAGIERAARAQTAPRRVRIRPLSAVTAAAALCLCLALLLEPGLFQARNANQYASRLLDSQSAGGTAAPTPLPEAQKLSVPAGSISVGGASQTSGTYRNLFAALNGGGAPIVMVNDAVYRLLISPTSLDSSLLGASLGEVTEYTLEPALSDGGIVSNIVSAGETVYAVRGMKGALAAARVSGNLRLFQRVSYAGTSTLGSETLADTLSVSAHATAMELTGVGMVTDAATADTLLQTLLSDAEYENASFGTDDNASLVIALDNGLLVQLMVGEDTVSACGTWSCPDFFTAFQAAVSGA